MIRDLRSMTERAYGCFFFFSSRRRHTRFDCDWSSDVCSSDLAGPVDVVLVFKGASLAPADVAELRRRCGGRWVNWVPDDPPQLELATRLPPAYDPFFTHHSSRLPRPPPGGAPGPYLPVCLRPRDLPGP